MGSPLSHFPGARASPRHPPQLDAVHLGTVIVGKSRGAGAGRCCRPEPRGPHPECGSHPWGWAEGQDPGSHCLSSRAGPETECSPTQGRVFSASWRCDHGPCLLGSGQDVCAPGLGAQCLHTAPQQQEVALRGWAMAGREAPQLTAPQFLHQRSRELHLCTCLPGCARTELGEAQPLGLARARHRRCWEHHRLLGAETCLSGPCGGILGKLEGAE